METLAFEQDSSINYNEDGMAQSMETSCRKTKNEQDAEIAQVGKTTISLWIGNVTTEKHSMRLGALSNIEDFFEEASRCCGIAADMIIGITILLPVNLAIPVPKVDLEHLILPMKKRDNFAFVTLLLLLFRAVGKPLPPGMLPRTFDLSASVTVADKENAEERNMKSDLNEELIARLGKPRKTVAASGSSWEYAFTAAKMLLEGEIITTKRERKAPSRLEGFVAGGRAANKGKRRKL